MSRHVGVQQRWLRGLLSGALLAMAPSVQAQTTDTSTAQSDIAVPAPAAPPAATEPEVDQDQRMVALQVKLTAQDWPYTMTEQGNVRVISSFTETKRTQAVFNGGKVDMLGPFPIRDIWTYVADVKRDKITAKKALELLRANAGFRLGTWEISGDLLTLSARLSDDIDAASLNEVLTSLAQWADDYEKDYSGARDDY